MGRIERIEEDARGLRVIGRLSGASGPGRDAAALLKDGAINGLSFGYRARSADRQRYGRVLSDVELLEISLVTFPMQPLARSEEHTSELQSLMRISYAVFCLKKTQIKYTHGNEHHTKQR